MDFVYVLAFASAAFNAALGPARSLNDNNLGLRYDSSESKWVLDMSGILKLAEALPKSQLTSLRWPTSPLNFAWTLCPCLPLRQ